MPFKFSHFKQSLLAAARGVAHAWRAEQNFRFQVFVAIIVVIFSFIFPLKNWEVILIVLLIVSVLTMELLNTVVEQLADLLKPRLNQYVSVIKDLMAGATLITAIGAAIIGAIIFIPHFLVWLK